MPRDEAFFLAAEGVTTGCGEGNYCPERSVNRAEMAVFLTRMFNLPLPGAPPLIAGPPCLQGGPVPP